MPLSPVSHRFKDGASEARGIQHLWRLRGFTTTKIKDKSKN